MDLKSPFAARLRRLLMPRVRPILPKTARSHRIWTGPVAGRRICTSWYDYPAAIVGVTERRLLEWFISNVSEGETWLDVGACYGYTSVALCKAVGPKGRVFAFEPNLATAGCLAQTGVLNLFDQLTVLPVALGEPEQLVAHQLPTTRGMIDSTIQSGERMEKVIVARLDWMWDLISGENRDVHGVKIDVQGMEIDVLRGMTALLRRCRPKMVIELHRGVDRSALIELLRAAGYMLPGRPIDLQAKWPLGGYLDDLSYAFLPNDAP